MCVLYFVRFLFFVQSSVQADARDSVIVELVDVGTDTADLLTPSVSCDVVSTEANDCTIGVNVDAYSIDFLHGSGDVVSGSDSMVRSSENKICFV